MFVPFVLVPRGNVVSGGAGDGDIGPGFPWAADHLRRRRRGRVQPPMRAAPVCCTRPYDLGLGARPGSLSPVGQVGAGVQCVGMLGAHHPLHRRQQLGEHVRRTSGVPPPHPSSAPGVAGDQRAGMLRTPRVSTAAGNPVNISRARATSPAGGSQALSGALGAWAGTGRHAGSRSGHGASAVCKSSRS